MPEKIGGRGLCIYLCIYSFRSVEPDLGLTHIHNQPPTYLSIPGSSSLMRHQESKMYRPWWLMERSSEEEERPPWLLVPGSADDIDNGIPPRERRYKARVGLGFCESRGEKRCAETPEAGGHVWTQEELASLAHLCETLLSAGVIRPFY